MLTAVCDGGTLRPFLFLVLVNLTPPPPIISPSIIKNLGVTFCNVEPEKLAEPALLRKKKASAPGGKKPIIKKKQKNGGDDDKAPKKKFRK